MSSVPGNSEKLPKGCKANDEKGDEKEDEGKKEDKKTKDLSWLKMDESSNDLKDKLQADRDHGDNNEISSSCGIDDDASTSATQRKGCHQLARLAVKRTIQVAKIVSEFAVDLNKDLLNDKSQANCKLVITKLQHIVGVGRAKLNYIDKLINCDSKTNPQLSASLGSQSTEQVVLDSDDDGDASNSSTSCGDGTDAKVKKNKHDTTVKPASKTSHSTISDGGDSSKPSVVSRSENSNDGEGKESTNSADSRKGKDSKNSGDDAEKYSNESSVVTRPNDSRGEDLDCSKAVSSTSTHKTKDESLERDPIMDFCDSIQSSDEQPTSQDGSSVRNLSTSSLTDAGTALVGETLDEVELGVSKEKLKASPVDVEKLTKSKDLDGRESDTFNGSDVVDKTFSSECSHSDNEKLKKIAVRKEKENSSNSVLDFSTNTKQLGDAEVDSRDEDGTKTEKKTVSDTSLSVETVKTSDSTIERDLTMVNCSDDGDAEVSGCAEKPLSDKKDGKQTKTEKQSETDEEGPLSQSLKLFSSGSPNNSRLVESSVTEETDDKVGKSLNKSTKESDDDLESSVIADLSEQGEIVKKKNMANVKENDIAREELNKLLDADTSDTDSISRPTTPVKNRRLTKTRKKKKKVDEGSSDSDTKKKSESETTETKKSKPLSLKKGTSSKEKHKKVVRSSSSDKTSLSSDLDDDNDRPIQKKRDPIESVASCSSASFKFLDPKLDAELKVVVEKMDVSMYPAYVPQSKSKKSDSDTTDSDAEFAKLMSMKSFKKKKKANSDEEGKGKRKSKTNSKQKQGASKKRNSASSSENPSEEDANEVEAVASSSNDLSESEKPVKSKKDLAREALSAILDSTDDDDSETEDEKPKKNLKKRTRTEDSDSDFEKKMAALKSKKKKDSDDSSSDDFAPSFSRKTRSRCAILSSRISSESDSNLSKKQTTKRKKKNSSNDSDKNSGSDQSTDAKKKKQTKRRRIKKMANSSDDDDSDVKLVDSDDKVTGNQGETPTSKGRKNIRRVLKDSRLHTETKQAAKEEDERRKRVADLQKLYNEVVEEGPEDNKVPITTKLVLAFDKETKEPLLSVHPNLIKKLKPHQVEGVKFMWESTCESLERIADHPGSGCILAHCMGLGKTLQVITYVHTLLKSESTGFKTCLIVCPLNTVLNWFNEFKYWLEDTIDEDDEPIEVSELTNVRNTYQRVYALRNWIADGGVMIMGYEMFRNFANEKMKRVPKSQRNAYHATLVDPGPDLVVCDEGHILKNSKSALSQAMDRIRSKRRIILTGTPLQNNLEEYHCMVSFVKPNLLGTLKEFQNRFMNPINNGQCADSTQSDVRIMKRRAHILHNLLDGCVQRRDYAVLVPFLQPKQEYVISVRLTEAQIKLYSHYMEHFARKCGKSGLFADYTVLCRIWTHPWVLRLAQIREENKVTYDSESSFIDDDDDNESSSSRSSCISIHSDDDGPTTSKGKKADSGDDEVINLWKTKRRNGVKEEEKVEKAEEEVHKDESVGQEVLWWNQFVSEEDATKVELSGKVLILFDILKECEAIGDKVLLFSQSLLSLDLLEDMLQRCGTEFIGSSWSHGLDYFRLDGSTSADLRMRYTKLFNDENEFRARLFLISTRAGSLGINLVSANRVVIFDASWNPTHDVQSIFRVYRFGQKKPVYIYRLLAQGTMEEKIYDRQVTKLSLSIRVLDEQQVDRHFNYADLQELYNFEPDSVSKRPIPMVPKDRLLADLLIRHKDRIVNYHEHDSLLVNVQEEELSEEDRKAAWVEYEVERKGLMNDTGGIGLPFKIDVGHIIENIQQKHPGLSIEELKEKLDITVKMVIEAKKQQALLQQQQQLQQQKEQMQWRMQMEQMKVEQMKKMNQQQQQHIQQQQQHIQQQFQQRLNNPLPNIPNIANLANQFNHLSQLNPAIANRFLQAAASQYNRQQQQSQPKSTVTIEEIID